MGVHDVIMDIIPFFFGTRLIRRFGILKPTIKKELAWIFILDV